MVQSSGLRGIQNATCRLYSMMPHLTQLCFWTVLLLLLHYALLQNTDSSGGGSVPASETDGSLALFNKTAGKSGETPPHQDNHYFCLDPPNCITIWVALDPVTQETGALRYLPYSHLEGPWCAHVPVRNPFCLRTARAQISSIAVLGLCAESDKSAVCIATILIAAEVGPTLPRTISVSARN